MITLRSCSCALVLACCLATQQPTIALQALTPPTATVTSGTQSWSQSLPAGPLPANGTVAVGLPTPRSASFSWTSTSSTLGAELRLTMFVGAGPPGSVGQLGQGELLVTFAANAPAPWRLEGGLGPGAGLAGLGFWVDLGNDGTIDWTPTTYGPIGAFGGDLSAQPLVMRVIYYGETALTAVGRAQLDLRVVPGDASALRLPTNCYNPNLYEVDPLFSQDADFQLTTAFGAFPTWQVLGFSLQPTTLPISLTGTPVPCLLMPSTDYVLRTPTMFLQVPATLRPLTIYAQSFYLSAGDLLPSDTFVMTAN